MISLHILFQMVTRFNLSIIYVISFSLPILLIFVSWCFFFSRNYDHTFIPTISETMVFMPQIRIFGVGMTIEAVFVFLFGLIQNDLLFYFINKKKDCEKHCIFLTKFNFCLIIVASFMLILLALCPVKYYWWPHMVGAFGFFSSIIIYFCIYDYLRIKLKYPLGIFSFIFSSASFISILLTVFLRNNLFGSYNAVRYSFSSIFQYLTLFFLLCKIIVVWKKTPVHYINVSIK